MKFLHKFKGPIKSNIFDVKINLYLLYLDVVWLK